MERTGLWWDMESCPLPPYMDPFNIVFISKVIFQSLNIRGNTHHFCAYEYLSEGNEEVKQILVNCGIQLQEVHVGNSYEIEKTVMSDVLFWAMDTPFPAHIIFIVGKLDFSNMFQNLRKRAYNVFLICPSISEMPPRMTDAANACIEWSSILQSVDSIANPCFQGAPIMEGLDIEHAHSFSSAFPTMETAWTNESKGFETSGRDNSFIHSYNECARISLPASSFHNHPHNEWPKGPTPSSEKKTQKPKPPSKIWPKKKGSFNEVKAWLHGVVNSKKFENGYNISSIYKDFETATGKNIDLKFLGFLKLSNLMEELKDVVLMREVSKGCHLLFPVKEKRQRPSAGGRKLKASAHDFKNWLLQMVQTGEFSHGCLMSCLYQKFEAHTGKILDLEYLGHTKLSDLVAQYTDIVSLHKGPGPCRLFPADVHRKTVSKNKGEAAFWNMEYSPSITEKKVDSGAWTENFIDHRSDEYLFSDGINKTYNEMYITETPGYAWYPTSFPSTETSECDFQNNSPNTKSGSSVTPLGSNASDLVAQPSNCIGEMSDSSQASATELIQQLTLTLQRKKNPSIGDFMDPTGGEQLLAESVEVLGLMKENNSIGRELSLTEIGETCPTTSNKSSGRTGGISAVQGPPASIRLQLDAPLSGAEVSYNLYNSTRQPRAEARMVSENAMWFTRNMAPSAESKENEKIGKNEEDGEKSLMNSVASPIGVAAGAGRKGGFTNNSPKIKGSMNDIREWLHGIVNTEQFKNGYNISMIYRDFENATGKALDLKYLDFLKLSNLIEELKDIVLMKEVDKGCHLLFPVKENIEGPLAGGEKPKASACDFKNWLLHMVQTDEFSHGCLMSTVYQKFERQTGKILDLKYLGYKKLSDLVAQYSDIVSLNNGPGPCRLFPADMRKETIFLKKNGEEALMNMEYNSPIVDEVFGSNAWKESLTGQPSIVHLFSDGINRNYNEIRLAELPAYAGHPTSFPITEISEHGSRKNSPNIMSDSSSTSGGSNASELEAHASNSTSKMPDSSEVQVTELIQQLLPTLQRKKKLATGDDIDSTRDEHLVAEAVQIVDLMRGRNSIREEPTPIEMGESHSTSSNGSQQSIHHISDVEGIPYSTCSLSDTLPFETDVTHYPYNYPQRYSSEARVAGKNDMTIMRGMDSPVEIRENKKKNGSQQSIHHISDVEGIPDSTYSRSDTLPFEADVSHYSYNYPQQHSSDAPQQYSSEAGVVGKNDMGIMRGMNSLVEIKENKKNAVGGEDERKSLMNSVVLPVGTFAGVAGKGLKSLYELTMWKKNR